MDKLKPILAGIKKHHFWILCGLLTAVVLYGWYTAFDELPVSFQANKTKVGAAFTGVTTVAGKQLAGPDWPDKAQKKGSQVKSQMGVAVQRLQAVQMPARAWMDQLSPAFMAAIAKGRKATLTPALITEFEKLLPVEVDKLRTVVEAAEGENDKGIQWNVGNFKLFRDQFALPKPPPVNAIVDAQERLWIAQAILHCVATINAPVKDKYNLPIYAIEKIEIGPLAAKNWTNHGLESGADKAKAPAAPTTTAGPPGTQMIPGLHAIPIRLHLRLDLAALEQLMVALEDEPLTLLIDDVKFDNALTIVQKEPPPPPPMDRAAQGAVAPAAAPAPPVDLGPPSLVQMPRGSSVEIQATCYLADPGDVESLKVALLGGLTR